MTSKVAWCGDQEPTEARFSPLEEKIHTSPKPQGGLWTSPYLAESGSAWCQWCLGEEFRVSRSDPRFHLWLLEPDPDARIYVIDSYADLESIVSRYPRTPPPNWPDSLKDMQFPSWIEVSRDFDAIHLTEQGQWATRLSMPLNLYGWDCESTLWLRWKFASVQDLGIVRVKHPWREEEERVADLA